ncbi:MAG: hypothetical protein A2Y62_08635 [Candidatus Fischerbacteria bacterium RBG_13_37_8]|uniref:Flagellar basal-body/hook protein C-terminal domain-containing protein n=1 Tax=Candidatus Fischerbacteria bacterium RBG_13_37_8 TaxID=1817863 RepID=A0A1F5VQW2_9BACT|nr:MAG: hypothetical protein A2Y62_08635 [Candidatus Fischerbacteria bacterium RBG_13_37_8]
MNITRAELLNKLFLQDTDEMNRVPMNFKEVQFVADVPGQSDMLYYLKLQMEIMRESREYQTISNVLKAKHDAITNAIRNIR